jgi:hypothetical protein
VVRTGRARAGRGRAGVAAAGTVSLLAVGLLAGAPQASAGTAVPARPVSTRTTPVSPVGQNPADAVPVAVDGQVQALAEVGSKIVVGGTFTQVKNPRTSAPLPRSYLFSYDRTTGRVDTTFVPVLDGSVDALQAASDGTSVYVAGTFGSVNGVARPWLARIDVGTGALVGTFSAGLNGRVSDLDLRAGTLYAAGWFTKSRTLALGGLAALNATTGRASTALTLALATTRVPDGVRTVNVTPDQTRMVVAGNFTSVGGVARDQIAMIDLSSQPNTVRTDWATGSLAFTCTTCTTKKIHTYVRDVAMSADGSYVVVGNTFYYPGNGDAALRFEVGATGSDIRPTWQHWTGTDTITAVTLTADGVAYIGGHFRWYGTVSSGRIPGRITRWGLAALDAGTGLAYEWVPTRERGYGVLAMLITSTGDLVIGHDTTLVGGELHSRLAMFPASAGRTVQPSSPVALPVTVTQVSGTGVETVLDFDGTTVTSSSTGAGPTLAGFRAGATVGGHLVAALADGFWRMQRTSTGWVPADRVYVNGVSSSSVTALAFQDETLYYTLSGDANLYARSMNADSLMVDPFGVVIAGPAVGAGRDYLTVRGLFAAGGYLYAGWADGHLDRTPMAAGTSPDTTVAAVTVSGPGVDSLTWSAAMVGGTRPSPVATRANLARAGGVVATQSLDEAGALASRAIDGNRDGNASSSSVSSTGKGAYQWWQVDLGSVQPVGSVVLWPRTDGYGENLSSPWVFVSDVPFTDTNPSLTVRQTGVKVLKLNGIPAPGTEVAVGRTARYIRVQVPGLEKAGVQLAEVEVLAP